MAMTSSGLSLSLDPDSLKIISDFQNSNFRPLLESNLTYAMNYAVSTLMDSMRSNMDAGFMNPTGALEDSMTPNVTPYLSTITMGEPYDWRREEGFSGMTDSLGRFYPNDPGIHYAAKAMSKNKTTIGETFSYVIGQTAIGQSA